MNCHDCKNLIHQMEEQSPDPDLNSKLLRHIEECPSCREEYQKMQHLISHLNHLKRDHQPELDLWPDIRKRIRISERYRNLWRYGLSGVAAGLVLLIGLSVFRIARQPSPKPLWISDPGLRQALQECETARTLLSSADAGCPVDTNLTEIINHNLMIIRIEQQTIRDALERHCDDPYLISQLFHAYTQELNLLEEYRQIRLNCTRRNS
ncbi:MAG: hypothetical protein KBA26_07855 [Candidatus Delongbacteria bacterium]|nr:hypothetical protein [Candidatus Delongbacteria bacterium]